MIASLSVMFVHDAVAFYTTVNAGSLYGASTGLNCPIPIANYGSEVSYGYNAPASDTHPQFYAALESHGADNTNASTCKWVFGVGNLHITVRGTDPLGNPLSGIRFVPLSDLHSPESSGVYQDILNQIYQILLNQLPYGIGSTIVNAASNSCLSSNYDSSSAWADWTWCGLGNGVVPQDSGLLFGFQLQVDPTLQGTYQVQITSHVVVDLNVPGQTAIVADQKDVIDSLQYCYLSCTASYSGGGGGNPHILKT